MKVPIPNEDTLSGIATLRNELHPENAKSPMALTVFGMAMLFKEVQSEKAFSSIAVMVVGKRNKVTRSFSHPHSSNESASTATVPSGMVKMLASSILLSATLVNSWEVK